ncbi:hypothetical protein EMIHUDRAFT_232031 [Emiliania huxleyi CCMP1516]|uniref:Glycosyl transferase family 25 domain-containing protein n=2 Tax=Emiliania huxleyi TaxID=2903 RepID=A0A0D3K6N5_EMIH1|nr:hypothetical protein EMIHUDRAFT_232031 [Emiliania huxleyi CCMP1516]EOD31420.1 hypothetical protein EMIHUDRAFT_232031 [Emiliania huxleyi CCMP1516]|eukprot:XP_005783849.1 hypothetical protein EMIHUDRAFT_232031 [Emiliania huxleyi CCMP1516]
MLALTLAAARAAYERTPRAVVINLPRHSKRLDAVRAQLRAQGVSWEKMPAVDGRALSKEELKANVTVLGRHLLTPGMIGCFLSHRGCWRRCVQSGKPLIVFEDDAVLMPSFRRRLAAALAELREDDEWDVLLLGAFGCVHPSGRDEEGGGAAGLGGAARARKLLEKLPRACFHVDNVAWGLRPLRLLCVHPLLAKQTHSDTTVGGLSGEEWIPAWFKQVDDYTGVSFSWAWNCPMVRLGRGGPLVTVGRAFGCSCIALTAAVLHASITRSLALLQAWAASVFAFGALIRLLSSQHK